MPRHQHRSIMTCDEALAGVGSIARPKLGFLKCGDFLKVVEALCGYRLTRRMLQFYSSPQVRLMPLPRYVRSRKSHYLHPENTQRLAVILRLKNRHFLPISEIKKIMARLSPNLYPLFLRGALTPEDIAFLGRPEGEYFHPYDRVFQRVLGLLPRSRPRSKARLLSPRTTSMRHPRWSDSRSGLRTR